MSVDDEQKKLYAWRLQRLCWAGVDDPILANDLALSDSDLIQMCKAASGGCPYHLLRRIFL